MKYSELAELFRKHEKDMPDTHLTAHIVFTEDSFPEPFSKESRTYVVSSFNKAYRPNMGGYSIFAYCLDGTDPNVRLERYMAYERGGKDGWMVEDCYLVPNDDGKS